MRVLLLNSTFYPDVVAVSQQLTDFAVDLAAAGHDVRVLTGNHGHDDPHLKFASAETYRGVHIERLAYCSFGKKRRILRMLDAASFHAHLAWKLLFSPRPDVVVALTAPPMIAAIGCLFGKWKNARFVYWAMDLNPDEAIAAGWLRERSAAARALTALNQWSLRNSSRVIALDDAMKKRLEERYGVDDAKIRVIPPWAHDDRLAPVPHDRNPFRQKHALGDKFVVMYSGNHSPCHPLDTMLEAARRYKDDASIVFCFIGGGAQTAAVSRFKSEQALGNILQLPYEPLDALKFSLSGADLHVAAWGAGFEGIVHPSKVYGILAVGRPFVLLGSENNAIADLIREEGVGRRVAHGDASGFVRFVEEVRAWSDARKTENLERSIALMRRRFDRASLSGKLRREVVGAV